MNTLSIVASFGALVWIFQDGNLSSLLGFQPLGFVETTQPVILFCVLFGLSMDYEVFLLSRMKEVWDRTGDNQEAVARGLERSGRIVTSAALIVVVVAVVVRLRRHRPDQGARDRDGDRGRPRRDGRPGAARAGDDAPPRRLELVAAARPAAGAADRDGGRSRPRRRSRWSRSSSPAAPARRSSPTRRRRIPPPRPRRRPRRGRPTRSRWSSRADDAPHDRLTEWWYDTGHLRTSDGRRYGFEFVIFRAERGGLPVSWASHLAITDETGQTFRFAQRTEIGPQVDRSPGRRVRPVDRARTRGGRGRVARDRPGPLDDDRRRRARSPRRIGGRRSRQPGAAASSAWTSG